MSPGSAEQTQHRHGLPVPGRLPRHQRLPQHRVAVAIDEAVQAERTRRVEDAIRLLGLSASANLDVSKLDNRTRQKVSVAREVARQPQFILFDEPITNVDAASKLQLKRSLKELTRSLSQTIVYVTHDQTEAMTLADQIALMEEGKIVQCAPPASSTTIPTTGSGAGFSAIPGWSFHCHTLGRR